ALVQSLYTLKLRAPEQAAPDLAALERDLVDAATSWNDRLRAALQETLGEAEGRAAARRWRIWFPPVYRETFEAAQALRDIEVLQTFVDGAEFGVQNTDHLIQVFAVLLRPVGL
ncbi:MAG: hypothetical protein CFE45_41275, partial [Burkholderiales bacterium PBB5]